jgi:hypothetical protein
MYVRVKHVKVSAVKNKYYIKNIAAKIGRVKCAVSCDIVLVFLCAIAP